MAENNENIKITVVEKRGKRGCDYGHRVGDIYDYAKDAGRLCPWMLTVANMYISKLKDGRPLPVKDFLRTLLHSAVRILE